MGSPKGHRPAFALVVAGGLLAVAALLVFRFGSAPTGPGRPGDPAGGRPTPKTIASPVPETDATGAIFGTVLRAGAPAEAALEALSLRPDEGRRARVLSPFSSDVPLATARAGADGRFEFSGLPPGSYVVRAAAPDGAAALARTRIDAAGARAEVRLDLSAGTSVLRGRAVWADGTPFTGSVSGRANTDSWYFPLPAPAVRTDAEGRFAIGGLPPGEVRLSFLVEGSYRLLAFTIVPRERETLFVVDPGQVEVEGRILDTFTRAPLAPAEVLAEGRGDGTLVSRLVMTGPDGRFRVRVPGESVEISAWAEGYGAGHLALSDGLRSVDIFISRSEGIGGRVIAAADGRPVAGVPVFLDLREREREALYEDQCAVSDAEGRFAFPRAPPWKADLFACGAGFVTPARVTLPAATEAKRDVTLRVVVGARVEVVVTDEAGRGLPGVAVEGFAYGFPGTTLLTGEAGVALFDSFPPATMCRFLARATGRAPVGAEGRTAGAGETTRVEIRTPRGRFIEVTVVEADTGRPISGAVVRASHGFEVIASTGSGGTARLGPMPPERLTLTATHADCFDLRETRVVPASEDDATARFELTPGLAVTGRVLLPDGRPAPSGTVRGSLPAEASGGVTPSLPLGTSSVRRACDVQVPIGEDGRFRLSPLTAGRVSLLARCRADGQWCIAWSECEAGTDGVVIRLEPGTCEPERGPRGLTFLVLDPEGRPVPRAEVGVWAENGNRGTGKVIDGEAAVPTLWCASWSNGGWIDEDAPEPPPPLVRYVARNARDHSDRPLPFGTVTGGPVLFDGRVEVRLPPEQSIAGRVVGDRDEGIEGVVVKASREPGATGVDGETNSGPDGSFRVGGLGDGKYWLSVDRLPEGLGLPAPVAARAGEEGVTIRLGAGAELRVLVRDVAGGPIAGAAVRAGGVGDTVTGADGVAVLRGFAEDEETWLDVTPPPGRADLLPRQERGALPGIVEVTLPPALTVRGLVRDEDGAPVSSGEVRAEWTGEFGAGDAEIPLGTDGSFRVGPIPPSTVHLSVVRPAPSLVTQGVGNDAPWLCDVRDVDPWRGDARTVPAGTSDVVLLLRRGHDLAVRIAGFKPSDDYEFLLSSATLTAENAEGVVTATVADDGVVRFADLPTDRAWTFFLPLGARVAYAEGLRADSGVATVEFSPGATISGRILAPPGVGSSTVEARGRGFLLREIVGADGRFTVSPVPVLPCEVTAHVYLGDRHVEASATARSGEEVEIDLRGE